ncbi:GWxTD domain-containing protein [candidate division KSB1 bacterium]|nr:GWxTD domain-containing protein [candidate division KSB1 bacterium]
MLKKFKYLFFISFAISLFPHTAPASATLFIDDATFRYQGDKSFTEIFYSLPVSVLTFSRQDSLYQTELYVLLQLYQDDLLYIKDEWKMIKTVSDTGGTEINESMVDLVRYRLNPGQYRLDLSIREGDSGNTFKAEKHFNVAAIGNGIESSQIVLAHSIKKCEQAKKSRFYKNGFEIIPNPAGFYGEGFEILFYYFEVYNLTPALSGPVYRLRYTILDQNGNPVEALKSPARSKEAVSSSVEIGTVDISSLSSGTYFIKFDILDNETIVETLQKKFYVYTTAVEHKPEHGTPGIFKNSVFAGMHELELNQEYESLFYIITDEERDVYANLTSEAAKARFLYEFWQKRDPSPPTLVNEYRKEYKRRIEFADAHYQSYNRSGWKTDRGRVYILFGRPADIERNPNNPRSYAHEIWRYDNLEGGVEFIFVDFYEFGEYVQIHSNKRGETVNQDWQKSILK